MWRPSGPARPCSARSAWFCRAWICVDSAPTPAAVEYPHAHSGPGGLRTGDCRADGDSGGGVQPDGVTGSIQCTFGGLTCSAFLGIYVIRQQLLLFLYRLKNPKGWNRAAETRRHELRAECRRPALSLCIELGL